MFTSVLLLCSIAFAETKALALQICLDREGYSCNTVDGVWGIKSRRALECYAEDRGYKINADEPEKAFDALFADAGGIFKIETLSSDDIASVGVIPSSPAEKAKMTRLSYESVKEMFAERGHLSVRALERMNPGVDWDNAKRGLKLVLPAFPSIDEELSSWPRRSRGPKRPEASRVEISLSRFEIALFGKDGKRIALFPCSIAKDKSNLPPVGKLKVTTVIARPNYTYTPDSAPRSGKKRRHIFPEGPNSPIGVAWIGLNLPGYGIHGTPSPHTIGNAESHGCFRLSNWNAARLYAMCPAGTPVIINP